VALEFILFVIVGAFIFFIVSKLSSGQKLRIFVPVSQYYNTFFMDGAKKTSKCNRYLGIFKFGLNQLEDPDSKPVPARPANREGSPRQHQVLRRHLKLALKHKIRAVCSW
jgi:hypothetical protein